MSEETLSIARKSMDAWNREDYEGWLALWDENGELYPLRAQLEGRAYQGHDGLRRFLAEVREKCDHPRFEVNFQEAGEHVLGIGRISAKGKASGADLDTPVGLIVTVRNGKAVHARLYSDPAEAAEAAGLSE